MNCVVRGHMVTQHSAVCIAQAMLTFDFGDVVETIKKRNPVQEYASYLVLLTSIEINGKSYVPGDVIPGMMRWQMKLWRSVGRLIEARHHPVKGHVDFDTEFELESKTNKTIQTVGL